MAEKKNMSESDKKQIKELFDFFDKNNNGVVSTKELELGLRWDGHNPTKTEIDNLLKEMGVQRGQNINFQQFQKCVQKYYDTDKLDKDAEEKRLQNAFKMFDRDRNGTVEIKELRKVLTSIGDKLTDEEVENMFKEADKNKDGKINYEEFSKMFVKGIK